MNNVSLIERRLLTIQEAAQYTGLSVHTLSTMTRPKRIPYMQAGRLGKFDRETLDKWIKQQTVMPVPKWG